MSLRSCEVQLSEASNRGQCWFVVNSDVWFLSWCFLSCLRDALTSLNMKHCFSSEIWLHPPNNRKNIFISKEEVSWWRLNQVVVFVEQRIFSPGALFYILIGCILWYCNITLTGVPDFRKCCTFLDVILFVLCWSHMTCLHHLQWCVDVLLSVKWQN